MTKTADQNERQALIDRLQAASSRNRLQANVLEAINYCLRRRKIPPATAMAWLKEEELFDQISS
jgi:hypothetical protein